MTTARKAGAFPATPIDLDDKGYKLAAQMPAAAINRELDRIDVVPRARLERGPHRRRARERAVQRDARDGPLTNWLTAYFQVLHERRADLMREVERARGAGDAAAATRVRRPIKGYLEAARRRWAER